MGVNGPCKNKKRLKVLLSKPGLDAHWRGIHVVGRALRDAGIEVIYGGNQTLKGIVRAVIDEDVDILGLSILAPSYLQIVEETFKALKAEGVHDVHVILGGVFLRQDIPVLEKMGIDKVFLPGTSLITIVNYVNSIVPRNILDNKVI